MSETDRTPLSAIAIGNLSFSYGERVVLEQCAMTLPVGAKACLLGRSGSGKSTLFKTISRLYQPMEGGTIRLFGNELNDVHLPDALSLMEQAPVMFSGTVRKNLTLGLDGISDDTIRENCLQAQVWHDIEIFGRGENTGLEADVGYRGKHLSGGQAQRLCLARCLVRQKPLLLLDEPVSAQDSKTIKEISLNLANLNAHGKPVTVLAITHDTDLLECFTHAVFMLNGRVVECDTKERLLARKGHYYRRMTSTAGLYVDSSGNAVITAERLRSCWLFSTGPMLSLQAVAKLFNSRFHAAGDKVIRSGEDADAMYVVVQGTVQV